MKRINIYLIVTAVLLIDRRYRFSDHMNALPYSWRPEYSADEQKIIDRIVAFISEI